MARLIDAEPILMKWNTESLGRKEMYDMVKNAPAIGIVRCKDCKFAHMTYGGECKYCDAWESEESLYLDGDFFCAFGERKE